MQLQGALKPLGTGRVCAVEEDLFVESRRAEIARLFASAQKGVQGALQRGKNSIIQRTRNGPGLNKKDQDHESSMSLGVCSPQDWKAGKHPDASIPRNIRKMASSCQVMPSSCRTAGRRSYPGCFGCKCLQSWRGLSQQQRAVLKCQRYLVV